MMDTQQILSKYMKEVSFKQLLNYIAIDIIEEFKQYPTQSEIDRVERILRGHFVPSEEKYEQTKLTVVK